MKSLRIPIFFLLLLIVAFLLLAGRCFYLQFFRSAHYQAASLNQQQAWVTQKPQRGPILDCQGRVLAASNEIQTIFAEPRIIKKPKATSNELAPVLDTGAHIICKLITESKNPGFVKIKVGATQAQCNGARKIYGIGVQSDWQRHYPAGPLVSHIVGFTSLDNRGLSGIELKFNKELTGLLGQDIFLADSRRRPIKLKQQNSMLKDGVGIILTVDATIQQFARAELKSQLESYEAESAVAIVAEPKTGAILAMVSLPDFDPNNIRSTDPNYFRNRALTDPFEPGSILKPLVVAIALDAAVIDYNEKIFCENGNYRGKGFGRIGEYRDRQYGNLAIKEILVHSSNIGMAKIGQKLGKKRLYKGLRLFGFGKKTGLDLPGEAPGLLWPVKNWTGYSVTRIPFGQEISVTAIQLLRAFCILANGGRAVRPYVVKAVVDTDGKVTKLKQPTRSVGFVIKPEVAKWVISEALTAVVDRGTGRRAKLEKWKVFGKTGTADIAKADARGYSEATIASFIAGAPAEDPRIVVLVSIRRPNKKLGKGYTGGVVASPVAAKIIEKTLTYLERRQIISSQ